MGAVFPILSLYLRNYLNFTGPQIGMVLAMSAVAAFITPFIGSFIADRIISKERLFTIFHILSAVFMILLSTQTQFKMVLLSYLGYTLMFSPTLALANAITFHHLPNARHNFGDLRVWGAIGWICVGWLFSFLWLKRGVNIGIAGRLPDALKLSAGASIIMVLFSFFLPASQMKIKKLKSIIPKEAFSIILKPQILVLALLSFFSIILYAYYNFGLSIFLKQMNFKESNIMPVMSIGQFAEIITLGTLSFFLVRFKFKQLMIFGILMALCRYIFFAIGTPKVLIYSGILFHGCIFAYFSIVITVYLDSHCGIHTRAGVHQLFVVLNFGLGRFLGNVAAGQTMKLCTVAGTGLVDFRIFWSIPIVISIICFLILVFFFKDKK